MNSISTNTPSPNTLQPGAIALTIAGSDSGGGAGIQADLKAMSALGAFGASVITALTAQNTKEVRAIQDIPVDFITSQLETVLDDLDVKAIKIGMLSQAPVIEAIATCLKERAQDIPIILDPVMVAKSGDLLLQKNAVDALKKHLLPLATLITPNLPEAGVLLGQDEPTNETAMMEAGLALQGLGPKAVLMKGGHMKGEVCHDYLITGDVQTFSAPRIQTANTHGTGCTLSASIAAFMAQGHSLKDAVKQAHSYLAGAIKASDQLSIGSGHGPVHHFYQLWDAK